MARRFLSCEKGNFAIVFSILAIPLLFAGGVALSLFGMNNLKSEYQQSLDSAVLAAAGQHTKTDAERVSLAENVFGANHTSDCLDSRLAVSMNGGNVVGTFACRVNTIYSGIVNPETVTIRVRSSAAVSVAGDPICILSLNPTMKNGFLESGGSDVNATGCTVHVNSDNLSAGILSGGSALKSKENCFVGRVSQGLPYVTPAPLEKCDALNDPFDTLQKPTYGACDHSGFSLDKPGTIYPGVYCGGISLKNVSFKMAPGLYVIKDGVFNSSGGASITGDGVTVFITGKGTGVNWSGGGNYHLSAMKTGSLAGFVVYLDPASDMNAKSTVSGGGDTFYEGVLYFPGQKLTISGGGTVVTPSPFTAYVADRMEFTGGSTFAINIDREKTDVPIPPGLYKNGSRSVRLSY